MQTSTEVGGSVAWYSHMDPNYITSYLEETHILSHTLSPHLLLSMRASYSDLSSSHNAAQ